MRYISKRLVVSLERGRFDHIEERAVNGDQIAAWSRRWKKSLGWRSGLRFFKKTNERFCYSIASRHWPHLLCWQWFLCCGWNKRRAAVLLYGKSGWEVAVFGPYIRYSRQNYDHMPATGPFYRKNYPEPIWAHHLQHLEPLGSA